MKLSNAIRLGSLLKPQAFGQFYWRGGSCALGAACDAMGIDAEDDPFPPEWNTFLRILNKTACPACGDKHLPRFLIPTLNDEHRWTRERIADFVATLENVPEPAPSGTLATLSTG